MTNLNDIFSCEELAAMVKEQERIVAGLHGAWKKAFQDWADARKAHSDAAFTRNEALKKEGREIDLRKTILGNTPTEVKNHGLTVANPDWAKAKQELDDFIDAATRRMTDLENKVKDAEAKEKAAKTRSDEAWNDVVKARQDLAAMQAALQNCNPKKKSSGLGGGILVGLGIGLAFFGWVLLHSHTTVQPEQSSQSSPVTTAAPHKGVLAPPSRPVELGPEPSTPKKKSIADEPLGEDRPQTMPQPQTQPQRDKNESDGSGSRDRDTSNGTETVSTGDSAATGNDSSDDGTHYEVSDSGGNTAVGHDSHDTTDTTRPQRTDDGSRQRTEDRPPQEDPTR